MRTFINTISLVIATTCLLTVGYARNLEDDWLSNFVDYLDPASEPVNLLDNIQQPAGSQKKIQVLAKYFRTKPFLKPAWVIEIPDSKKTRKSGPLLVFLILTI